MKRVIIESPYAGRGQTDKQRLFDLRANLTYARRCLRNCAFRGESALASHVIWTQPDVLDDTNPDERTLGIACGFAWWQCADFIIFFTDRGWSGGMIEALRIATETGKPFTIRALFTTPVLPPDGPDSLRQYVEADIMEKEPI